MTAPALEVRGICVQVPGGSRALLDNVSLRVGVGEFVVLAGPNGAGKSTLLRVMSGELVPQAGEVFVSEQRVGTHADNLRGEALARARAMLPQKRDSMPFPVTSEEVALLGRHPHRRTSTSAENYAIVHDCMKRTDSDAFSARIYGTLSGGEAGRVDLARLLAQQAGVVLLDEPTNHLDPRHQIMSVSLCRELARAGHVVIAALHDLNLASQFADRIVLMRDGAIVADDAPASVLTPEQLRAVYDVEFDVITREGAPTVLMPRL